MVNWYRAAARYREGLALKNGGRVEVPTLIVWGEGRYRAGAGDARRHRSLRPDLTIRRLPGVSHWVQQEAPEKVNAILEEWLPRA
ncbi:alpha/beta fold hydrolase [Sphingomonas sp. MMS24-JH45]